MTAWRQSHSPKGGSADVSSGIPGSLSGRRMEVGFRAGAAGYMKGCILGIVLGLGGLTAWAGPGAGESFRENTSASITMEVEASYSSQGCEESSDVCLATFELDLESRPATGLSVCAVLLWEEDETEPVDLDEGYVVVDGRVMETLPLFLKAGRMYLPFGTLDSCLISSPLTQELGETRKSAVIVGCGPDRVTVQVGVFNGDLDEPDGEDELRNLVAAVRVTPVDGVELGGYWISDMGESDGLRDELEDAVAGAADRVVVGGDGRPAVEAGRPGVPYREVAGAGGYVSLQVGAVGLGVEYVSALEDFRSGLLGRQEARPAAWNLEVACALGEKWEISARYEGCHEFPDFPEDQYGGAVRWTISDAVALAVEYLHGEFAGTEDPRDQVTAQLAVTY